MALVVLLQPKFDLSLTVRYIVRRLQWLALKMKAEIFIAAHVGSTKHITLSIQKIVKIVKKILCPYFLIVASINYVMFLTRSKIKWHFTFVPDGNVQCSPYALCTIFTILWTLWNSEQKNRLLIKLFCFHPILMKLGEVLVTHVYYNFSKFFLKKWMKTKIFINTHFSVQNFKVSVEFWKSYIVCKS